MADGWWLEEAEEPPKNASKGARIMMVIVSEEERNDLQYLIALNERYIQSLREQIKKLEEENEQLIWELQVIEKELTKTS
jgi:hypothetical protein